MTAIKVVTSGSGGTGSTALASEKLEDAASADGDKGLFVLAVRNDTFAALTSTDGDYSGISVDSKGRLALAPAGALAAAGPSTLMKNEDAASASGDGGVMMLAVRRDTPGTQVSTDGDYAELQTDANGRLRVSADEIATAASLTSVASQATNIHLLGSNTARRGCIISNDDPNPLYVKYGATASLTSYTVAIPGSGYWEMPWPIYTGAIDGIWGADGSGSARITELT